MAFAGYARSSFERAAEQAGLKRGLGSLDLVELDDTYSFKLLQHLASLARDKEEASAVLRGQGPALNPSGGSLAVGNLLEASALHRLYEAVLQLRGEGGRRQVKGREERAGPVVEGSPDGDGRGRDTLGGRMTKRRVAVIGAGMTLFRRRLLETGRELSYEASAMALDAAGMERKDVESVVIGSRTGRVRRRPHEGRVSPRGSGRASGRPTSRVYVGGGTGVFSPIGGWWHVASGLFDTCMVVAEEKMSPLHPHPQYAFWSIFDHTLERPLGVTLLWIFALEMRRYMHVYGIKEEDIALVAVKNKLNALDHPVRPARGEDNRGRRDEEREARLAGQEIRRLAALRRRVRDGARLGGGREEVHRRPGLDRRRGLERGHPVLDEQGPLLPRVPRARREDGLQDGEDRGPAEETSTSPRSTTRSTTRSCTTWRG